MRRWLFVLVLMLGVVRQAAAVMTIEIIGSGPGSAAPTAPVDPWPAGVQPVCFELPCPSGTGSLIPGQPVNGVTVNGGAGAQTTIPIDPQTKVPTPPGWSPPSGNNIQPTPPASAASSSSYSSFPSVECGTIAGASLAAVGEAVATCVTANDATVGWIYYSHNTDYLLFHRYWKADGSARADGQFTYQTAMTCPAGYSVSGTSCVLSNAAQVPKPPDGICTILRSGNTFSGDPMDPDCALSSTSAAGKSNMTGLGTSHLTGGDIGSKKADVVANADGSSTVTVMTVNNNNTTTMTTINMSAPGTGGGVTVTGTSQTTVQGTGTSQTTTPASSTIVDLSATNSKLDALKSGQCGGAGQPKCGIDETGLPADDGGARFAGASGVVDTSIAALKSAAGVSGWSREKDVALWPGFLDALPSGSDGDCVNPRWMWAGRDVEVDICRWWSPFKSWLAWLLYAGAAVYIWRRFVYQQ